MRLLEAAPHELGGVRAVVRNDLLTGCFAGAKGMDGHEYTYLVRGNKTKLQPGMVFSCEPAIYIDGEFGLRIEDDFVVTEDGARLLGGMFATAIDQPLGA